MTRDDFLLALYLMYKGTFSEENIPIWGKAYKVILKSNWDYDKLFKLFVREYDKTNIAPAPAYFLNFKSRVEPEEKVKNIRMPKEEEKGEPPTKEFLEAMERMKKKMTERAKTFM